MPGAAEGGAAAGTFGVVPRSRLWRHPDFLRLWSAQTISELGSQISLVALPFAAIGPLHATAFEVAALATLGFAPFLLFGLPAGVWVDRLPPRRLLVVSDFARGVLLLSVPVAYWLGVLSLAQLFVVGFDAGTFTVFFSVAYQAYLPSILPRSRTSTATRSSRSLAAPPRRRARLRGAPSSRSPRLRPRCSLTRSASSRRGC